MNAKRRAIAERLLLLALLALVPVATALAGLCDLNQDLTRTDRRDRLDSDYFDDYAIGKRDGVYRIYASKRVRANYAALVRVMNAFDEYPQFMPGYQRMRISRSPAGEIYNGIRYRAGFAFFTSRFTTAVEVIDGGAEYWQCWNQLDEDDAQVIEEYASAPRVNRGFWRFVDREDGTTGIEYYSAIRPPVPIPAWLYRQIAGGSYEEVFEAILERARSEP